MGVYTLFQDITSVQPAPTPQAPPISPVQPQPASTGGPQPTCQAFQLLLTGIGSCSASAQIVVSNDGENWAKYGDPVTVTGAGDGAVPPQLAFVFSNSPWNWFGAYVTAISGTKASASLNFSA